MLLSLVSSSWARLPLLAAEVHHAGLALIASALFLVPRSDVNLREARRSNPHRQILFDREVDGNALMVQVDSPHCQTPKCS